MANQSPPIRTSVRGFRDRREAGVALAGRLEGLRHENPVVLALPRGGVPVAFEVALRPVHAPLDVMVVEEARCAVPTRAGDGCDRGRGRRVLDPRDGSHRGGHSG